jgi:hypothetical protein
MARYYGICALFLCTVIMYSIFSEFNDHLAQAKVSINLGSEVVEAYSNIQRELTGEVSLPGFIKNCWNNCNYSLDCILTTWKELGNAPCDPAPAAEWKLPWVSLPGFIKNCWNNCNFSLDCILTTWKELGNAPCDPAPAAEWKLTPESRTGIISNTSSN